MKKIILHLFSFALLFISCKNEPNTATPPAFKNTDLNSTQISENVIFNTQQSNLLYKNYLAIKAAMVNTDSAKTEIAAKTLASNFSTNSNYGLAKQIASLISSTSDIKKQRELFVGLTNEVTNLLKSDIKSGKIHQQYCPMAFDGKGAYWLSNSKEIRNPYFGDVMLACGEVTTIFR